MNELSSILPGIWKGPKMNWRAIPRQEVGKEQWNEFVDQSDEAWFWHRFEVIDALLEWPGRSDVSFAMVDKHGVIGAIVAANVVPYRVLFGALRFLTINSREPGGAGQGGPAFRNALPPKQQEQLAESIRGYLFECAWKTSEIRLGMHPMVPALRGERCPRTNPLVTRFGMEATYSQNYILDLRVGRDGLWRGMEHRARKNVRQAEKNGITVRIADRPDDLDAYYAIHSATLNRNGESSFPRRFFEVIWSNLHGQRLVLSLFAENAGCTVACANFAIYKNAAYYWTAGSNALGLSLRANILLQWRAIELLLECGVEWYDVGGANLSIEVTKSAKDKSISTYKKAMGGELYPAYGGRFDLNDPLYISVRTLQRFRQNASTYPRA
jgi:hypothetical protein